jgi:hypothetical protein
MQASGLPGNPIILYFEPDAKLSAPYWTSAGALSAGSYTTIDGGSNGIIECTANGTLLANQQSATGISFQEASGFIVKNLTIQNLYVRVRGTDLAGGSLGIRLFWNGGGTFGNDLVTNCVFHDMAIGFGIDYGPGSSNIVMRGCTAYNVNWGGNAGDHSSASSLNGLLVQGNTFYSFTNWDETVSDSNHHNGFYGWAESGGFLTNVTVVGNLIGPGFGGPNQTSGVFFSGQVWNLVVNNNLFIASDGTAPADGFIFIWLHSGGLPATAHVWNNSILGGGNGVGVAFYSGFGSNLTIYDCKNNLIQNVPTAISLFDNAGATLSSDCNVFFGVPDGTAFNTSPNSSSNFKGLAAWQALGHDLRSTNSNPNLDGNYVPQAPSPAMNGGINFSTNFALDRISSPRPAALAWSVGAYETPNKPAVPAPTNTMPVLPTFILAPQNLHVVTTNTPLQGGTTNLFVTSERLGTLRNDYAGTVGMYFSPTVSSTITALGRWVVAGSSQMHTLYLLNGSGFVLASAMVNCTGASPGQYIYAAVPPIAVSANNRYAVLSSETAGGDKWYDQDTSLTTSSLGTATASGAVNSAYPPVGVSYGNSGTVSFGPVNFMYTTP